jgi:hypothetical protein
LPGLSDLYGALQIGCDYHNRNIDKKLEYWSDGVKMISDFGMQNDLKWEVGMKMIADFGMQNADFIKGILSRIL